MPEPSTTAQTPNWRQTRRHLVVIMPAAILIVLHCLLAVSCHLSGTGDSHAGEAAARTECRLR